MRVCTLFEYPTLNGGERSWLASWPGLHRAGWEVVALAPGKGPLADALQGSGIAHVPLSRDAFSRATGATHPSLEDLRATLAGHLSALRPDVIHANSLNCSRWIGPVACQLEIPSAGHLRDMVGLSRQAVADVNCNTRLLVVSCAVRDWHASQGIDARRMHVLHNGVDVVEFQPRPATGSLHRELGLREDVMLVGAVGQLGMRKGWDVLLEAFAQVVARGTAAALIVVGERNSGKSEAVEFERMLLQRARQPDLCGSVHFLGRRTDVPVLMNECALLVHPARQEPFGRVLLEAMASGLPIVATAVGGTPEMFSGQSAGAAVLVPSGAAGPISDAICRLLGDAGLRCAMGDVGRRAACHQWNAIQSGQSLAEHLSAVCAAGKTWAGRAAADVPTQSRTIRNNR